MNNLLYFLCSFFRRIIDKNVYVDVFLFFDVSSRHSSIVPAFIANLNTFLTPVFYFFPFTFFVHQWFFSIIFSDYRLVMMRRSRQRCICLSDSLIFNKISNSIVILGFHLRKTISFSFVGCRGLFVPLVLWFLFLGSLRIPV